MYYSEKDTNSLKFSYCFEPSIQAITFVASIFKFLGKVVSVAFSIVKGFIYDPNEYNIVNKTTTGRTFSYTSRWKDICRGWESRVDTQRRCEVPVCVLKK